MFPVPPATGSGRAAGATVEANSLAGFPNLEKSVMSKILDRIAAGAFAFFVVVAITDVSVARAQTQMVPQPTNMVPTACGDGYLLVCGFEKLIRCDYRVSFNWNPPYSFGFNLERVCYENGERQLYMGKYPVPAGGRCSTPLEDGDYFQLPNADDSSCS